jgi:hypothetical protein
MSLTFNASIPLADGSSIQVVPDTSSGGFLLLNYVNAQGAQVSSTPLTQIQARSLIGELQGVTSARSSQIAAGV